MSEDNKDVQYILGEVSGKMDGLTSAVNNLLTALITHTAADDKNFKEIREDIASLRIAIAKYAGGAAVVGAVIGALAPVIFQQLLK